MTVQSTVAGLVYKQEVFKIYIYEDSHRKAGRVVEMSS